MILAIDVGNTNIVIGCMNQGDVLWESRIDTNRSKTKDDYAITLKMLLDVYQIESTELEGAIISSVVPVITNNLRLATEMILQNQVLVVNSMMNSGLKIEVENKEKLGTDRIVDAVAAVEQCPLPLVIYDLGTATTCSVIDEKKRFIGGAISPGLKLSLEALSNRSSQLPNFEIEAPNSLIGVNTTQCLKSGLVYGTACMMDGMIERIEKELSQKVHVVVTGGCAPIVLPYCKRKMNYDKDLLLKGLWILFQKNKK